MSIPIKYKEIFPGEDILGYIDLTNMVDIKADVTLDYVIKDMDGNIIEIDQETVAVENYYSKKKSMKLPKDLEPGDYVYYVKIRYQGELAMASDLFSVISKEKAIGIEEQMSKIELLKLTAVMMIMAALLTTIWMLIKYKVLLETKRRKKH